ncbi:MAG: hypothetical protein FWF90_01045 [Promicromonosporaceae bacterium]|nr:hypothetical protein [Promicromonosporaceae bacterium]
MWYLPELFREDATYATYIVALIVAGLLTIIMGSLNSGISSIRRLGTVLLGLVFLGYGAYLYLFLPSSYFIAYYVFLLPIVVVVNVVRAMNTKRRAEAAEAGPAAPVTENPAIFKA